MNHKIFLLQQTTTKKVFKKITMPPICRIILEKQLTCNHSINKKYWHKITDSWHSVKPNKQISTFSIIHLFPGIHFYNNKFFVFRICKSSIFTDPFASGFCPVKYPGFSLSLSHLWLLLDLLSPHTHYSLLSQKEWVVVTVVLLGNFILYIKIVSVRN